MNSRSGAAKSNETRYIETFMVIHYTMHVMTLITTSRMCGHGMPTPTIITSRKNIGNEKME